MPPGRERGAGGVAVHQGKIYYAGGLNGGFAKPWFDVYDPAANTWSQLPNMPVARDHFQAQVANGKFWVTGGRDTAINNTITSTIAFDFSTGTWQTIAPPLPGPGGFASAVLGDEILVIGGREAVRPSTRWRPTTPPPTAGEPWPPCPPLATGSRRPCAAEGCMSPPAERSRAVADRPTSTRCSSWARQRRANPRPPRSPRTPSPAVNSWGTADTGGPWTVVAGTAANFDVDGARGTVATPGGSQQQAAHLGQVSVRDVDLRVALTFPDAPTASGNIFGYLLLRRQANGSYYRVGLYVTPGGKVFIRGQTDAGANLFPDVDTGLSFLLGTRSCSVPG